MKGTDAEPYPQRRDFHESGDNRQCQSAQRCRRAPAEKWPWPGSEVDSAGLIDGIVVRTDRCQVAIGRGGRGWEEGLGNDGDEDHRIPFQGVG